MFKRVVPELPDSADPWARSAVWLAKKFAQKADVPLNSAHLLLGICKSGYNPATGSLKNASVPLRKLKARIRQFLVSLDQTEPYSLAEWIDEARVQMATLDQDWLGAEHLLLAVLSRPDSHAHQLLSDYEFTYDQACAEVIEFLGGDPNLI